MASACAKEFIGQAQTASPKMKVIFVERLSVCFNHTGDIISILRPIPD